jgi:hypothetical protein
MSVLKNNVHTHIITLINITILRNHNMGITNIQPIFRIYARQFAVKPKK